MQDMRHAYVVVFFVIICFHQKVVTEVLDSPYLPWRTVLDDQTETKNPTATQCRLPAYPKNGSYIVVAEPAAKPGDVFENVTLVRYSTTEDGEKVEIKALSCYHGKWSESLIDYTTDRLYFNTSWCPLLCSPSDLNKHAVSASSASLTDTYNAIKLNMNAEKPCVLPPYPAHGMYLVIGKPGAGPGDAFGQAALHQYVFDEASALYEVKALTCAAGIWYATHLKWNSDSLRFFKSGCPWLCSSFYANGSSESSKKQSTFNSTTTENIDNQTKCELPPYPKDGNYSVTHQAKSAPGDVFGAAHLSYSCHSNRKLVGSKDVYCIEGTWSDELPQCIQCGSIKPFVVESVSADEAARRELPWHVAIYDKTKSYEHICSGSIIATNLIVTAAHCFFRDAENPQLDSRFAVAAGKVYSDWNSADDKDTQRSNVVEIITHPRFRKSKTDLKNDLALVLLDTPLNYTEYVTSVCLNFDPELDEKQSRDVKIGKVGSWNSSEGEDREGSKLRVDWAPYVDTNKCISEGAPDFRRYVTSDKICAGDVEGGAAPCAGDLGGGLTYRARDDDGSRAHYLRGVASASSAGGGCGALSPGVFTHVLRHEEFFKEHMKKAIWN